MKRKHYPILTVLGAVLLTCLPLAILLACSGHQNPNDQLAVLTSTVHETSAGAISVPTQREGISGVVEPRNEQKFSAKPSKQPDSDTRDQTSAQPVTADVAQRITTPPNKPVKDSPVVTPQIHDTTAGSIDVDLAPVLIAESTSARSVSEPDMSLAEAMAAITGVPDAMSSKPNHYQSTGHLALRNSLPASESMATAPINAPIAEKLVPEEQGSPAENGALSEKSRDARAQRSKTDRQASNEKSSESSTGNPRRTRENVAADADKQTLLEDVLIQTPVENSSVSRVENLVASTRAKGWPIALIRSDLPDDVWWVQQVIGIQGNSFAARVNFGNEYSLSGSVYRMVIVFLDTPDEVRRFRIAKQFKEIPEGTRRSREFHYIRE